MTMNDRPATIDRADWAWINQNDDEPVADGPKVHRLPVENLEAFKARFDKLVKRAGKLGVPAPTYTVHGVETVERTDEFTGFKWNYDVALVSVAGDAPKFDGWAPLAVIDLDPEDGDGAHVVHVIGGGEADPGWRAETDRCDHCTQSPRGRKKLVVVEHDDGVRKVVGTTCVKDFLGHRAPEAIASWFEILASLDDLADSFEDGYGGSTVERRYDPESFLGLTVLLVQQDGWVPRSRAFDTKATADQVEEVIEDLRRGLAPTAGMTRDERALLKYGVRPDSDRFIPTEQQAAAAAAALEWARDLSDDDICRSDYLANIAAVANKAGWRHRDIGLGASIYQAYERANEREIQRKLEAEKLENSEWIGEVGDKVTFEGDVLMVRYIEGAYGTTTLIKVLTGDGNAVTWFSSSGVSFPVYASDDLAEKGIACGSRGIEAGDHVFGKGTIKDLNEYNGVKETLVTRAKLSLEPLPEPKARKARKTKAVA